MLYTESDDRTIFLEFQFACMLIYCLSRFILIEKEGEYNMEGLLDLDTCLNLTFSSVSNKRLSLRVFTFSLECFSASLIIPTACFRWGNSSY